MSRTEYSATDRQISFIKDLLHSRIVSDAQAERCRQRLAEGSFSKALASESIDWFLKQPKVEVEIAAPVAFVAPPKTDPVTEIGIYELGDQIFKVKRSKNDRLYAEKLIYTVGQAERLTAAGTVIKAKYTYAAGAIHTLSPENRVTGERAKELSVIFTSCIVCGRHLKNALSVERAIGPVCWKRV